MSVPEHVIHPLVVADIRSGSGCYSSAKTYHPCGCDELRTTTPSRWSLCVYHDGMDAGLGMLPEMVEVNVYYCTAHNGIRSEGETYCDNLYFSARVAGSGMGVDDVVGSRPACGGDAIAPCNPTPLYYRTSDDRRHFA